MRIDKSYQIPKGPDDQPYIFEDLYNDRDEDTRRDLARRWRLHESASWEELNDYYIDHFKDGEIHDPLGEDSPLYYDEESVEYENSKDQDPAQESKESKERREKACLDLGIPPDTDWEDLFLYFNPHSLMDLEYQLETMHLPPDGTWEDIYNAYSGGGRRIFAKWYGMPEDSTWKDINNNPEEILRKELQVKYGVAPWGTFNYDTLSWEDIWGEENRLWYEIDEDMPEDDEFEHFIKDFVRKRRKVSKILKLPEDIYCEPDFYRYLSEHADELVDKYKITDTTIMGIIGQIADLDSDDNTDNIVNKAAGISKKNIK